MQIRSFHFMQIYRKALWKRKRFICIVIQSLYDRSYFILLHKIKMPSTMKFERVRAFKGLLRIDRVTGMIRFGRTGGETHQSGHQ